MTSVNILFALLLIITTTIALPYDEWQTHTSPLLARKQCSTVTAHDPSNHTIWLIGGSSGYPQQMVSFNYINNQLTDYGAFALSSVASNLRADARGQTYAQFGSIVYFPDPILPYLHSFNVKTGSFTYDALRSPINFGDAEDECLVNIRNAFLTVLSTDTTVQIYNISSQLWLIDDIPSFQMSRTSAACIYHNDKMFIIGGQSVETIEYLNVSNSSMNDISSTHWNFTKESFPQPVDKSRAVIVNESILVIGGQDAGVSANTVYIIDINTESVSVGGYLDTAVSGAGVIFTNGILYAFGGNQGSPSYCWTGWQSHEVFRITSSPTQDPITSSPTSPSQNPTNMPSEYPTTSPSQNPTNMPSEYPTTSPSQNPTNMPSEYPTTSPSQNPTNMPSEYPTTSPSQNPTNMPSEDPTTSPTHQPPVSPTAHESRESGKRNDTISTSVITEEIDENKDLLIILGFSVVGFCVLFIAVVSVGFWVKKRKQKQGFAKESGKNIAKNHNDIINDNIEMKPQTTAVTVVDTLNAFEVGDQGEVDNDSSHDSLYNMEGIVPEAVTVTGNTTAKSSANVTTGDSGSV